MAFDSQTREFSAERRLRIRRLGGGDDLSNADLYHAIQVLREEVAALRTQEPSEPIVPSEHRDDESSADEALAIRVEIAQMVRVIGRAKVEIASIKHPDSDDDRMQLAASELDAIVVATETSTQDILGASERIETCVRTIVGLHPEDPEMSALGDQIANEIINIFEACNFQDITGQRINKVVKTIRFIEEKILTMINIWGAEAFMDLPVPSVSAASGDDGLMNGPQLENQGITQDEINALFD